VLAILDGAGAAAEAGATRTMVFYGSDTMMVNDSVNGLMYLHFAFWKVQI
jgi:hypothetical protein